jgi:hypothetical protein
MYSIHIHVAIASNQHLQRSERDLVCKAEDAAPAMAASADNIPRSSPVMARRSEGSHPPEHLSLSLRNCCSVYTDSTPNLWRIPFHFRR